MSHESAIVGAFNYLWGYHDAQNRTAVCPCILSNAQNFLDELLGDMVAQIEHRYFIIEFKQTRPGFEHEVHGAKAKPARFELYNLLYNNGTVRALSTAGHYACWADTALQFEFYANAPGPGSLFVPVHILNTPGAKLTFSDFYDGIHNPDLTLSAVNPSTFANGIGLPLRGMVEYLEAMVQTNPAIAAPSAGLDAILGIYNPATKQTTRVPEKFEGLLAAFMSIKAKVKASSPSVGMMN